MPECAKTHLQQSRISKISGGGPPDPLFKGMEGEGRGGEGGEREGKEGEEGRGETGRDRGGRGGMGGGGEGRGARHGLRPPLETSSGSAPGS